MRDQVKWFAEKMETKLKENDHKGGWEQCDFRYLFSRLYEEVHEVWAEYNQAEPKWENIIREAADVANFAMMIADKARQAERNNRNS